MIEEFRGEYWFLSNFYLCEIVYRGWAYSTAEHFFQCLKARNNNDKMRIWKCRTAREAKKMGRRVELRPDWDNIKLAMMHTVLYAKFQQNSGLRKRLFETRTQELVEGNYWHMITSGEIVGAKNASL